MFYVQDYKLEPAVIKTFGYCDECGGDLYEGDTVYKIDGDVICEDCLSDYFSSFKQTLEGDKR